MPTTPNLGLPYPTSADTADVPRDIKALADGIDGLMILQVGMMMLWPGGAAPPGNLPNGKAAWLICNGQVVLAVDYPKLAALLGAPGGNVTVPDLRDRVPVGASATRAVGTPGGEATHLIAASELPAHKHPATGLTASVIPSAGAHTHPASSAGYNFVISDDADLAETWGSNAQDTGKGYRQLWRSSLNPLGAIRSGSITGSSGAHTHPAPTISGNTADSTGGGSPMKIDPLNVALNFVMRAA